MKTIFMSLQMYPAGSKIHDLVRIAERLLHFVRAHAKFDRFALDSRRNCGIGDNRVNRLFHVFRRHAIQPW
jgi:hypothetical protein